MNDQTGYWFTWDNGVIKSLRGPFPSELSALRSCDQDIETFKINPNTLFKNFVIPNEKLLELQKILAESNEVKSNVLYGTKEKVLEEYRMLKPRFDSRPF